MTPTVNQTAELVEMSMYNPQGRMGANTDAVSSNAVYPEASTLPMVGPQTATAESLDEAPIEQTGSTSEPDGEIQDPLNVREGSKRVAATPGIEGQQGAAAGLPNLVITGNHQPRNEEVTQTSYTSPSNSEDSPKMPIPGRMVGSTEQAAHDTTTPPSDPASTPTSLYPEEDSAPSVPEMGYEQIMPPNNSNVVEDESPQAAVPSDNANNSSDTLSGRPLADGSPPLVDQGQEGATSTPSSPNSSTASSDGTQFIQEDVISNNDSMSEHEHNEVKRGPIMKKPGTEHRVFKPIHSSSKENREQTQHLLHHVPQAEKGVGLGPLRQEKGSHILDAERKHTKREGQRWKTGNMSHRT